jgi:undecaprenyl-phosphate 4-deoxy-4-formamido-L-arabinose transferase
MCHDDADAVEVRLQKHGDCLGSPLSRSDERVRLLDDLLRSPPRGQHSPECAGDRAHGRPRRDHRPCHLERVGAELDRIGDGLDRLLGEPARAVRVVLCDPLNPLRHFRVHVGLLEGRYGLQLPERPRVEPLRRVVLLVQPNGFRAATEEQKRVHEPACAVGTPDNLRRGRRPQLEIVAPQPCLLGDFHISLLERVLKLEIAGDARPRSRVRASRLGPAQKKDAAVGTFEKSGDNRCFRDRADGSLSAMAEIEPAATPLRDLEEVAAPDISLVVPIYNEQETVQEVYRQSVAALETIGRPYEIIVVDDGSTDGTWAVLERLHAQDEQLRAVRFKRNFGQHPAMHAGLVRARGEIVVTMDGDLQNSPADLPKLVAAVQGGADVASGRRHSREDAWGRTLPSRLINVMLRRFTKADISDFGCAFNAYSRAALAPVIGVIGKQKFTKALVLAAGANVVEVELEHRARQGRSRYSPLRLARLALHVLAGFWPQPIQWAGVLLGTLCGLLAFAAGMWATVVWALRGDFPGLLYLGALVLGVLAVQGFILALVGEYLGRIQRDVEGRPLYTVETEL